MMTAGKTANWLANNDDYLILTHRRPDGDTLGCAGALASELRRMGKNAYVLKNPEITSMFADLVSDFIAPDGYEPKHVISVDTASADLLPFNAMPYSEKISLCIDHHISTRINAEFKCVDADRASCGELMYDILIELCGNISPEAAGCLYTAIATETGCFAYANTTAESLKIASKLVQAGAPHKKMNKSYFRTKTRSRVKLEAMIYSNMEFYFDGAAAIVSITQQMLAEIEAGENDLNDISALAGVVEGVTCAVTIRELGSKNVSKVSVRSLPGINSNDICARLGGGGHAMAAGATVAKSIEDTKAEVLLILEEVFGHYDPLAQCGAPSQSHTGSAEDCSSKNAMTNI